MTVIELKEVLLGNGKLQWRAVNTDSGDIIEVAPNRKELIRQLRQRALGSANKGGLETRNIR